MRCEDLRQRGVHAITDRGPEFLDSREPAGCGCAGGDEVRGGRVGRGIAGGRGGKHGRDFSEGRVGADKGVVKGFWRGDGG